MIHLYNWAILCHLRKSELLWLTDPGVVKFGMKRVHRGQPRPITNEKKVRTRCGATP